MDAQTVAEQMRERNQKVITLPTSGLEIRIRKLTQWDFIERGLDIPLGAPSEQGAQRGRERSALDYAAIIFGRGVVEPRVVLDDGAECGAGEIHVYDLGDDIAWVMNEIQEFSGLGKKAEVVDNFREAPQAEPGDA